MSPKNISIFIALSLCFLSLVDCSPIEKIQPQPHERVSPKLMTRFRITNSDDPLLIQLDESLAQISTIYIQALFSNTHTPELERNMDKLQMDLYDQLEALLEQRGLNDYIRYEREVTRQLMIYDMIKKLVDLDNEEKAERKEE